MLYSRLIQNYEYVYLWKNVISTLVDLLIPFTNAVVNLQIDLTDLGDYAEHFDAKTLCTDPVRLA